MRRNTQDHAESGNVILIILLAVSLLAGLTFVFTDSSRTSSGLLTSAQEDAEATKQQEYANAIAQAKKRLLFTRCEEEEISYETPDGDDENPLAPSDESCHIFRSAGGAILYNPDYPSGAPVALPTCGNLTDFFACSGSLTSTGGGVYNVASDCKNYCETVGGATCCFYRESTSECTTYDGAVVASGLSYAWAANCAP